MCLAITTHHQVLQLSLCTFFILRWFFLVCDSSSFFSLCVQVCLAGGERQSVGEELTTAQKVPTFVCNTALQVEQGFIQGCYIVLL